MLALEALNWPELVKVSATRAPKERIDQHGVVAGGRQLVWKPQSTAPARLTLGRAPTNSTALNRVLDEAMAEATSAHKS